MSALKIKDAAVVLGVGQSTLRRLIAAGAPVSRRGGRGRGKAALLDPAAIEAWRAAQGPLLDETRRAAASELAATLPDLLVAAVVDAHRLAEGIDKRALAGILAGAWYVAANAILDRLRRSDPTIAEISSLPPEIERLRKIAR